MHAGLEQNVLKVEIKLEKLSDDRTKDFILFMYSKYENLYLKMKNL